MTFDHTALYINRLVINHYISASSHCSEIYLRLIEEAWHRVYQYYQQPPLNNTKNTYQHIKNDYCVDCAHVTESNSVYISHFYEHITLNSMISKSFGTNGKRLRPNDSS